jgi:MOSC domain-containing protein YiiM
VQAEGALQAGDAIERIHATDEGVTVSDVVALRTGRSRDMELLSRVMGHSVLSDAWKESLERLFA